MQNVSQSGWSAMLSPQNVAPVQKVQAQQVPAPPADAVETSTNVKAKTAIPNRTARIDLPSARPVARRKSAPQCSQPRGALGLRSHGVAHLCAVTYRQ
ncbi:MAG: hypothetical protein ABI629_16985 [bacterium]